MNNQMMSFSDEFEFKKYKKKHGDGVIVEAVQCKHKSSGRFVCSECDVSYEENKRLAMESLATAKESRRKNLSKK